MGLREKYNHAIQTAKSLGFDGSAQEQNGKLHFNGLANSQEDANKIWNAIKAVPDWQNDIVADIKVNPSAAQKTAGTTGQAKTYTVKAGDTLSKIAKEQLGDANGYQEIFEANRDQLTDPDKIKPGQVLKIPSMAR